MATKAPPVPPKPKVPPKGPKAAPKKPPPIAPKPAFKGRRRPSQDADAARPVPRPRPPTAQECGAPPPPVPVKRVSTFHVPPGKRMSTVVSGRGRGRGSARGRGGTPVTRGRARGRGAGAGGRGRGMSTSVRASGVPPVPPRGASSSSMTAAPARGVKRASTDAPPVPPKRKSMAAKPALPPKPPKPAIPRKPTTARSQGNVAPPQVNRDMRDYEDPAFSTGGGDDASLDDGADAAMGAIEEEEEEQEETHRVAAAPAGDRKSRKPPAPPPQSRKSVLVKPKTEPEPSRETASPPAQSVKSLGDQLFKDKQLPMGPPPAASTERRASVKPALPPKRRSSVPVNMVSAPPAEASATTPFPPTAEEEEAEETPAKQPPSAEAMSPVSGTLFPEPKAFGKDNSEKTMKKLLDAVSAGNVAQVQSLVDGSADVNGMSWDGWTPLHMAAYRNQAKVMKVLLDAGAHHGPEYVTHRGETALSLCFTDSECHQLLQGLDIRLDDSNSSEGIRGSLQKFRRTNKSFSMLKKLVGGKKKEGGGTAKAGAQSTDEEAPLVRCVATMAFEAQDETELSFEAGDLLFVTAIPNAEWFKGRIAGEENGHVGKFPFNHVRILKDGEEPPPKLPRLASGEYLAIAMHEFVGEADDELSFKEGEPITVLDTIEGGEWYKGRKADGCEGIFPANHVEIKDTGKDKGDKGDTPMSERERRKAGGEDEYPRVVAVFDFEAESPDELSLVEGEIITILDWNDGDWYTGKNKFNAVGMFPATHVEIVEDDAPTTAAAKPKDDGPPKVVARFTFDGAADDELSFNTGDVLTILDWNDGEWYTGKTALGRVGLFPADYVMLKEDADAEEKEREKEEKEKEKEKAKAKEKEKETEKEKGGGSRRRFVYRVATANGAGVRKRSEAAFDAPLASGRVAFGAEVAATRVVRGADGIEFLEVAGGFLPVTKKDGEVVMKRSAGPGAEEEEMSEYPRVEAMFDFKAEADDELSFSTGDVIIILDWNEGTWYTGKLGDNSGHFPGQYVEFVDVDGESSDGGDGDDDSSSVPTPAAMADMDHFADLPEFDLDTLEMLAKEEGDDEKREKKEAERAEKDVHNWDKGGSLSASKDAPEADAGDHNGGDEEAAEEGEEEDDDVGELVPDEDGKIWCHALYDFEVQDDNEMELKAGDILEVSYQPNDEWCVGTAEDGRSGWFPRMYVRAGLPQ